MIFLQELMQSTFFLTCLQRQLTKDSNIYLAEAFCQKGRPKNSSQQNIKVTHCAKFVEKISSENRIV